VGAIGYHIREAAKLASRVELFGTAVERLCPKERSAFGCDVAVGRVRMLTDALDIF
jgi:hypothetical protein